MIDRPSGAGTWGVPGRTRGSAAGRHTHAATVAPPGREAGGRPPGPRPAARRVDEPPPAALRPDPLLDTRPGLPYDKNRRLLRREPRVNGVNVALALIAVVLVAWLAYGLWGMTRVDADLVGLADGAAMTSEEAADLAVELRVSPERADTAGLLLDGRSILEEARRTDAGISWTPVRPLSEGRHTLELLVDRPILPAASFRWTFTVDDTAPALPLPAIVGPVPVDQPVVVEGRLADGERMWIDGEEVPLDDGRFRLEWELPPLGPPFEVRVLDAAGNETTGAFSIPVAVPEIRGVHVRAEDWADPELRAGILALVDEGLINAVQLDLKDEAGLVGYTTSLDEVRAVGAAADHYDLRAAVEEIHARGARFVGRLVAFNDPVYAEASWEAGARDRVVQTPDGQPLVRGEGMFLSFAHPDVRAYVSAIAIEAAEAGVDDILLDYVRRPDGYLDEMVLPGLATTPEEGVVAFLAELAPELRARGTLLGASVFGIAARAPTDIGQDIPMMSAYLDYVAPMVYPSHFAPGSYDLEDPNRDPFTLVARSTADFQDAVAARGIAVVPWLQDFSFRGVIYDTTMVRAQIDAACQNGIYSHLMWNARSSYTVDALGSCP
jgi:hypothetical protein